MLRSPRILRATLMRRGYPSSALPIVTYDEEKRSCMLERLARNRFQPASTSSQDVIVFKCPYSIHIRRLGIHKECTKLMQALKSHLDWLDARIILAHPIKQNLYSQKQLSTTTNRQDHMVHGIVPSSRGQNRINVGIPGSKGNRTGRTDRPRSLSADDLRRCGM